MHSSISSFERPIPEQPWPRLLLLVALLVGGATLAWELHCRAFGYAPTLNDTEDLWAQRRRAVQPDSLVLSGDSRPMFDLDLDVLEQGLGRRPVQLSLPGSCAYPVLADLAADESFHGTLVLSIVPGMFLAPGGPLVETSEKALKRYRTETPSQRAGNELGMLLEEHVAFLKQEDLTLAQLLKRVPFPARAGMPPPLRFPPYFQTVDRERRARMIDACARPGELRDTIRQIWLPLFTPPPPPPDVPLDKFMAQMQGAAAARIKDTADAVQKIRARGGKVVLVRFPNGGELKALEEKVLPRAQGWDKIVEATGAPAIHYEDHPDLAGFECPEWSHLSAPDSVEFTRRLVPYLKGALGARAPGSE